jgi:peptide/nickel transport system permease protein
MMEKTLSKLFGKITYAALTIFISITLIFFVIRLSPGDPAETILGQKASIEEIAKLRHQLNLDLPLILQYKNYLMMIVRGDLGNSLIGSKNVKKLLEERMFPTMTLAICSVGISAFMGVFLGMLSAINRKKIFDLSLRVVTLVLLSFPIFSLAPILVLIFAISLNWLPVSEWGDVRHLILPVLTLCIPLSAILSRVTRNKFLEESNELWSVVCRAKGLSDFQIALRILKVCLPTILNIISIQLSSIIAGAMITETIFDIPGVGTLLFDGIQSRDYPIVQGVIIYSTTMYMLVYFLVDFINSKIDPRSA